MKIIAASVDVFEAEIRRSMSAGYDDFLPKPIRLDILFTLLQKHLNLVWIYVEPLPLGKESSSQTIETEALVIPSEEIDVLYDLAMKGELPRLKQYSFELEKKASEYEPFARRLRELVEAFDEDQIMMLIKNTKTISSVQLKDLER